MRVAIDAGGTFTDVAIIDESGRISSHKVLSHPEDPAMGMLHALDESVDVRHASAVVNGTTAGLNAVLARTGTRVLVVTTAGFEDVVSIGRAHRVDVWELRYPRPEHLVATGDVCGIGERIRADGTVERAIPVDDLAEVSSRVSREGVRSVAVCLLHATSNPAHELAVRDFLAAEHPGLKISVSHEVAPEVGEFERFSSTIVNAYVATTVGEYLSRVTDGLATRGYDRPLLVMRSSGGVTSAASAQRRPMQTLLSGPAGGVIGAQAISRHLGRSHLLALDMGGTSLDASVVVDQRLAVRADLDIAGIPVLMPVVDLVTVSAGGGSIAWAQHGALHVGPQSAGGNPGPACYGLGGTEPTVTDANVVLGRLGHAALANDAVALDRTAAVGALAPLATELGMSVEALAQAIVDITDARMSDALRTLTVRRGHDPRDFSILAFGGAGPLHAAALADELGITSVIVPPAAGVFSAWGMLHAPVRHDLSEPLLVGSGDLADADLEEVHARLLVRARELVAADGVDPDAAGYVTSADVRYAGQQFSITVELPLGSPVGAWDKLFRERYERTHGTVAGHPSTEFVNARVTAVGPDVGEYAAAELMPDSVVTTGTVVHHGAPVEAVFCNRGLLGDRREGPAVVSDPGSTIYVPPGWSAAAGPMGTVLLSRIEERP
ncbi:hydantoinase/oxoprolinase family protein [Nocardioides taihuensis]|uniref:Hydantoinase/oxoprolinase family protein n=1 Tax=Nocardioides taihuensis TaxID=1835606 RepID=A0ABW0BPY4_9ACTN